MLTPESAAHWAAIRDRTGVLVVGRRLFDFTKGWNGNHPLGLPVVVVTHAAPEDWPHPDAPFTFVTGGIEAAIAEAQAIAGDKIVAVNAGTIASQCAQPACSTRSGSTWSRSSSAAGCRCCRRSARRRWCSTDRSSTRRATA